MELTQPDTDTVSPTLLHWLEVVVSLVLLGAGASALVRGSASMAVRLGVSPLVVGLTIVAYGTSTPELLVSARAAWEGRGDIALGNVVGSNSFNVGVILGLAALMTPLQVRFQLIRQELPLLLVATGLFWVGFRDAVITRVEAGVFVVGLVGYTVFTIFQARRQAPTEVVAEFDQAVPRPTRHAAWDVGLMVVGLGLLVYGAELMVRGATALARDWGVSEAVMGLTIVAAGTSLPELATSVVAAVKRQPDIAVGNVVGSNLYNLLAIVGCSGLLVPLDGPGLETRDLVVMTLFSVALVPILWTGLVVRRWEGVLLLAGYGVYLALRWPTTS